MEPNSAGRQVGAYRLLQQIGEGGMGSVWLAEHVMLGRRAAVKLLHPSFSSQPEVVSRFFNEARAATQISDPGIVQIFDFGHDTGGHAYIAMELLEGEPLDQRLHRLGRLPVKDAARILRQVASSLGAAHARNIVHRDLKPENIYLVHDPEVPGGERAKILDFGIAKLIGEASGPVKTQANAVMGTPVYMAPEQCRGSGGVDARSDVYALGCVLFTLLAGAPPFTGDAPGELLVAHMTQPAPRVTSVAPHVPLALDALIGRCLEKDPAARFQHGAELAAALGALLTSVSGAGLPPRASAAEAATAILPGTTTLGGAAAQATAVPPSRAGARRWLAGLGALAVAGAVLAAFALRDRRPAEDRRTEVPAGVAAASPTPGGREPAAGPAPVPAPAPAPPSASPPAPAPPSAPAPAPAPAAPAKIAIAISTRPAGAQVFVAGDKHSRGTTPFALEVEPSDQPLELRIARRGYLTRTLVVERTASSTLTLALERDARRRPRAPAGGGASTAPVPPASGIGHSDDTMNPFAKATNRNEAR